MATINMQIPEGINNDTMALVVRFASALAEKLRAAEIKYGYSNKWMSDDWMDECREKLAAHLRKGDPRDVAAYCAFLWHHEEPTYSDTDSHVIAQWERDQKASARIAALEAANAALVAECERLREALEMSKQDHRDDLDALALVRRQRDEAVRELKAAFARATTSPKEPKDV